MRKFLMTLVLTLMTVLSINAQTAIETPKALDNIYVGVGAGVTTPLDFNSVFPLNTAVTARIGKELTPAVGFEVEGLALLNDNHFTFSKTAVKSFNLGGNVVFNLSNIFGGYPGAPRHFEVKANAGLGWLHNCGNDDPAKNFLTAKTALDFAWNIGHSRVITLLVSPGIYWNLNGMDGAIKNIKFNKHAAQAAILGTLVWHFKTSNGTRHFKTYDVGAMINEIDRLNEELAKKPTIVEKVVVKEVQATPTAAVETVSQPATIGFAQGSWVLTDEAKATLDELQSGTYDVYGYASPEGSKKRNDFVSQKRAEAVAEYLKAKGAEVKNAEGQGVAFGDATNRIVIIKAAK